MAAPAPAPLAGFPRDIVEAAWGCRASVDYSPLVSTREGEYSAHLPYHSPDSARALSKHFPGLSGPVLDATAGVGGDTLHILHTFPQAQVTAVEVGAGNWEALRHNLSTAGYGPRSTAVRANFLSYARERAARQEDAARFVFFDPPWGGRGQWKAAPPHLALEAPAWATCAPQEGVPLSAAIDQVFLLGLAPRAVAKVPPNYDIGAFESELCAGRLVAREPVRKRTPHPLRLGKGPPLAYWLLVMEATQAPARGPPPL